MMDKFFKFKEFVGPKVWRYFLASFVLGLAWFAVESSFVFVLQGFLFSIGLLDKSQAFLPSWYPVDLASSMIILIVFGIARSGVLVLKNYFATITQVTFQCEQRKGLLSYGLHNAAALSSKNLISAFTEITSSAASAVNFGSILITTFIAAFLFFLMGLKLAPREMIIGIILLIIILFPIKYLTKKINGYGLVLTKEWENVSDYLLKGLRNFFFLSIYNQIGTEVNKGKKSLDNYLDNYSKYAQVAGIVSGIPQIAGICVLSFIAYLSVNYFHTNSMKLVSFLYLFIRLAQAASEANATLSSMRLVVPAFKILYDWKLKLTSFERGVRRPAVIIDDKKIEIEFDDVAMRYGDQHYLFQNLSFKISQGNVFIIKGESGVGKSSLLSMILDVRKPSLGNIFINQISTKIQDVDLQNVLAYVGPEPFLIAGSVRENLFYGLPDSKIEDSSIWHVLRLMKIADLVNELPRKLDEMVYDIPQFSTGQKQRLSFARALLRKPRLIVLDEATANLDSETEKIIIDNLKDTMTECTTVIVTHKDSFDRIGTHFLKLGSTISFTQIDRI